MSFLNGSCFQLCVIRFLLLNPCCTSHRPQSIRFNRAAIQSQERKLISTRLNYSLHHHDRTDDVLPHARSFRNPICGINATTHGPLSLVLNFPLSDTLKKRDLLEDVVVDGNIIIKWIFELICYK